MGIVKDVQSKRELDDAIGGSKAVIVHFWASWCEASKQMDQLFAHLSTDFPHALFLRVEAEEQPEISEAYAISTVPYFVFCKGGKTVDILEGANPSSLANKVAKVAGSTDSAESASPASLGMAAGSAVLEAVKEQAKENGSSSEASGGVSDSTGLSPDLTSRLETLTNSSPVMLFMKGKPEEPKCGFSRKVVDILQLEKVRFETFDVLSDDEVRQGLKVFSNWSSYPQLYIDGELIGGSDIVLEMHKSGELKKVLSEKGITLEDRLKNLISSSQVMLFIKGTPDAPRCGFSSKVVDALREEGVSFGSFDILSDDEVRQGLKTFSNWPTFPQLYYKGELVGGCDIILELHNSGELKAAVSE